MLSPEEYEARANEADADALRWDGNRAMPNMAQLYRDEAQAYHIAAAALRWYAAMEAGGDDYHARQALTAACREATR